MNRLTKLLNLIEEKKINLALRLKKIKLGQDTIGDRGKDGRLRETHIRNMVYSGFSSFSLSSPDGLPATYARKKIFMNDEEIISEDPECPGEIIIEEDTCIHGNPLGECDICEEESPEIEEN